MALDVYAGPLSRYHAANWKTIGQQISEQQGIHFQVVRPGQGEDAAPPKDVTRAIVAWQSHLLEGLRTQGLNIDPWPENQDIEYRTDRPGWEGLMALNIKAYTLLHPESKQPATVPSIEEMWSHPAHGDNVGESALGYLSGIELWLPGTFEAIISGENPVGNPVHIASIGKLTWFLDYIREKWGLSASELQGKITNQPGVGSDFEEAALHGLVVFLNLAHYCQDNEAPLVLDY
jgi:hypothetical protein